MEHIHGLKEGVVVKGTSLASFLMSQNGTKTNVVGHVKRIMNSCSALPEDRACKYISNSFQYLEGSNIPRDYFPRLPKRTTPFQGETLSITLSPTWNSIGLRFKSA
nr:hypothetical protein [Tanacetum cinerariifolium]